MKSLFTGCFLALFFCKAYGQQLPAPEACVDENVESFSTVIEQSEEMYSQVFATDLTSDGEVVAVGGVFNEPDWWIGFPEQGDITIFENAGLVAKDIQQTPDGGFIVIGGSSSPFQVRADPVADQTYKAQIFKLDANRNIEWERTFNDPDSTYFLTSVNILPSGNFAFSGFKDGSNVAGSTIWIFETTAEGISLWENTISNGITIAPTVQIRPSTDGGFIGAAGQCPDGAENCLLGENIRAFKLDSQGNLIWSTTLDNGNTEVLPHYSSSYLSATRDGGLIVAATQFQQPLEDENFWLVKLDANGNVQWETDLGPSTRNRGFSHVQELANGCFLVSGTIQSGNNFSSPCFLLFDAAGTLKCQKVFFNIRNVSWIADVEIVGDSIAYAANIGATQVPSGRFFLRSNGAAIDGAIGKVSNLLCPLDLPEDTLVCTARTLNLESCQSLDVNYTWQDGSMDAVYTLTENGTYAVTISNANGSCTFTDEINVEFLPQLDLGPSDTILCNPEGLLLTTNLPEGTTFEWQDGSTSAEFVAKEAGKYLVTAQFEDCVLSDSINVTLCDPCVEIPNAFTPDGDDLNDTFRPYLGCIINQYNFKIYNRWGQVVFESNTFGEAWDGTISGEEAPLDKYVYLVTFEREEQGRLLQEVRRGEVLLLR